MGGDEKIDLNQNNEIHELIRAFHVYTNYNPIGFIGGVEITVADVVVASLIARENMIFIGRPGWGKSQLIEDIMDGIFNQRAVYFRGRHDLDIKEVFERINLHKLRDAKTDDDVKELTGNVKEVCFVIDEINRAPPLIQNTFYGLMDGYISFKGKKYELGRLGYSIGIAAANLGDGNYSGTFNIDDALNERLHVPLNLSSLYKPEPTDLFDIFNSADNPRVKDITAQDLSEQLFKLHQKFIDAEADLYYVIFKTYLTFGLDWCPIEEARNSKSVLGKNFSSILKEKGYTHELATLTGTSMGMSPRTSFVVSGLARALEMVARAKGAEGFLGVDSSIVALKIIAPYSGIFDPQVVRKEFYSNPSLAAEQFAKETAEEVSSKIEPIAHAFKKAVNGELNESDLAEFKGKWQFMEKILRRENTKGAVEQNENKQKDSKGLMFVGKNE